MTSTDPQWESPVEIQNPEGRSPVVLLCEHASNFIPNDYAGLGLEPSELQRHIAWDIGAANVTRELSRLLDATAFLGRYSRLLIDLNRPLHASSCIVTRSESTDIPGNASLAASERALRTRMFYEPYHRAVELHLAERERAQRPTVIVAIHSFTPKYEGVQRPWHAGIIFDKAAAFGAATIDRLRVTAPDAPVDANVPYAVTPDEYYGLLVYGDHVGTPAILIEVRQDLIADEQGQKAWAERLAASIASDVALEPSNARTMARDGAVKGSKT